MGDQKVEVMPEELAGKSAWFSGFFVVGREKVVVAVIPVGEIFKHGFVWHCFCRLKFTF
jgi:hypothetical protein